MKMKNDLNFAETDIIRYQKLIQEKKDKITHCKSLIERYQRKIKFIKRWGVQK